MDVSAELESVKVVARKLMEQKSDSETSNLAPDFYFFAISSLKVRSKLLVICCTILFFCFVFFEHC